MLSFPSHGEGACNLRSEAAWLGRDVMDGVRRAETGEQASESGAR
jgi:hypothetical protein